MPSLLDTNVISQRTKEKPDERVMTWLSKQEPSHLYISAVSLAEVRFGIEEMQSGRKRDRNELWLSNDLRRGFSGRILPVDERVAEEAGRLTSVGKRQGHTPEFADALIAATARVHDLRLVTLNEKHFRHLGVDLVPF